MCLLIWWEQIEKLSLTLVIPKSSAAGMAAVLRKPVSIVYSGAGWYLTPHKGLVKFSSFCLPRNPQVALYCAGKTDPSSDRQVGKENVTVFPHVQKQSARRYSESCNVLKGGNSGGIETKKSLCGHQTGLAAWDNKTSNHTTFFSSVFYEL